jgi:hypothetical protein
MKILAMSLFVFVVIASPTSTPVVPPLDAHCVEDSDCAVTFVSLSGPSLCCVGCGTSTAGNKAWVKKVAETCPDVLANEHRTCPALACPSGRTRTECKASTCVLE